MSRILVVEDDKDVRLLVEHVLLREGYNVDAVATLAAARALLPDHDYHLVLADGALPDGTGMQIGEEAERRGIPMIVMTAYAIRFPVEELVRFEFMLKPVRPHELVDAVRKAIDAAGSLKSAQARTPG